MPKASNKRFQQNINAFTVFVQEFIDEYEMENGRRYPGGFHAAKNDPIFIIRWGNMTAEEKEELKEKAREEKKRARGAFVTQLFKSELDRVNRPSNGNGELENQREQSNDNGAVATEQVPSMDSGNDGANIYDSTGSLPEDPPEEGELRIAGLKVEPFPADFVIQLQPEWPLVTITLPSFRSNDGSMDNNFESHSTPPEDEKPIGAVMEENVDDDQLMGAVSDGDQDDQALEEGEKPENVGDEGAMENVQESQAVAILPRGSFIRPPPDEPVDEFGNDISWTEDFRDHYVAQKKMPIGCRGIGRGLHLLPEIGYLDRVRRFLDD